MVRLFAMSENNSPVPSHAGPSANPTGPATCSNVQLIRLLPLAPTTVKAHGHSITRSLEPPATDPQCSEYKVTGLPASEQPRVSRRGAVILPVPPETVDH